MRLLAELKRRNVSRMVGSYLVGAWLIAQVAGTLLPVFDVPSWVMKTLVGLLAVGFVLALVFYAAIAMLPELLEIPSGVTPALLALDPIWVPIRVDPRFVALTKLPVKEYKVPPHE